MSNPNLQQNIKQDWVESGIVMPVHMNDIGKNVNNLNEVMPIYSATGNFYDATLENSTYVLTTKQFNDDTNNVSPTQYVDGMEVQFKIPQSNSGNCSVNVNGLGAKTIKNIDNTQLNKESLLKDDLIKLRYNASQNCFHIDNGGNANRQLTNLTHEAEKHFVNKTQITNCILEAPNGVATYSGNTITIKQGLKVLIPNGRNADGTLKNIEYTLENDLSLPYSTSWVNNHIYNIWIFSTGNIWSNESVNEMIGLDAEKPQTVSDIGHKSYYATDTNKHYYTQGSTTANWIENNMVKVCSIYYANNSISKILNDAPVNLLKQSDKSQISSWGMPSKHSINLTLGASGTTYTAPANGWFSLQMFLQANADTTKGARMIYQGTNMIVGGYFTTSARAQDEHRMIIPIKKDEKVVVQYTYTSTYGNTSFQFYYAESEV